jgi:hypothetical protein
MSMVESASNPDAVPGQGSQVRPGRTLDPLDLFDIRSELSEEEILVQDTVARFVDDQVLPIIRECFEQHRFPKELIKEIAALGLLGSSIEGYDCAGLNSVAYGLICQELERGDSGLRSFVSVQRRRSSAGCRRWRAVRPSVVSGLPKHMADPTPPA